jgi:ABC-2 type transport system permease protein
MLPEQGEPLAGLVKAPMMAIQRALAYAYSFSGKAFALTEMEVLKLIHDPTELATRAIQPALWLLIFGQVMNRTRAIPTGSIPYIDFMAPGILAQSVLFISIFYGISIIWERDLGILQKFLVTPTPRPALVLGKSLAAGVRCLTQAVIIYILALALNVKINWNPLALLGVFFAILLGAAVFSTFSLIIACLVKTRERFMGIGQVMTMPLFFASNAIYPLSMMPPWLQIISHFNPLTYEVDALRGLMLAGNNWVYGPAMDFSILLAVFIVLLFIAGRLYPTVVI